MKRHLENEFVELVARAAARDPKRCARDDREETRRDPRAAANRFDDDRDRIERRAEHREPLRERLRRRNHDGALAGCSARFANRKPTIDELERGVVHHHGRRAWRGHEISLPQLRRARERARRSERARETASLWLFVFRNIDSSCLRRHAMRRPRSGVSAPSGTLTAKSFAENPIIAAMKPFAFWLKSVLTKPGAAAFTAIFFASS